MKKVSTLGIDLAYMNPPSWQEDKSVQTKKEKVHAYIRPVYGLFLSWP